MRSPLTPGLDHADAYSSTRGQSAYRPGSSRHLHDLLIRSSFGRDLCVLCLPVLNVSQGITNACALDVPSRQGLRSV
jgi:hypothetical protein